jgi:glycosyltransferase involved in cell wall biosynthesis
MRKKILYVITKSNWGGAQRYVFDLATALPKDRCDVAVVVGDNGPLTERLQTQSIRTMRIPGLARDISFFKEFTAFGGLIALLRRERPSIVHLNSSKAGALGALAARLTGVPHIIFTAHGWPFREQRNLLWRAYVWLGSWATALLAGVVICVSESDARAGRHLPFCARKMVCIHNGIVAMTFGSGERLRRLFPPNAVITGTIGELNKNKNHQALIEEARNDQNLFIAIVGEGEERARLEAKIREYGLQDRVKLLGFIPAEEALAGFDRFALPSRKEGLPYALLEAKQAGLPLFMVNRVGGVPEILDNTNPNEFSFEKMLSETMAVYKRN